MLTRLLFLLLLALNLGAAGWLVFGHAPKAALPPATDPGVPALRLVSQPALIRRATGAASASTSASTRFAHQSCHTLGPFTTAHGVHAAMRALSAHVARLQYREQTVRRSLGYRVLLPAAATRAAAIQEARRLAAKGIHDYYVVTAGDQQNTISLGLFDDRSNARHRRAKLKDLGFPAELKQRVDTEPQYWVDYAVPRDSAFVWKTWLPKRTDLHAKPIDCS